MKLDDDDRTVHEYGRSAAKMFARTKGQLDERVVVVGPSRDIIFFAAMMA